jgi:outer membrane lipoprotein carrier protein
MLKKLFIGLFISFIAINAYAQSATDKLMVLLQNLHTMQANFSQTISDNRGNVLQKSSGTMALQRPGLFRWDTTQPNQQLIIADGTNIWIYDKDLQQITQQKQNASSNAPGLLLSASVDQLAKRYITRQLNVNANVQSFELVPSQRDLFRAVILMFSNSGQLQQMLMHDNLGQTTQINFSHVNINTSLSSGLFHFRAPAGVDVVSG